ncbi:MAG: serine/threonine protein kinase [Planctomycetaceae bacterium]|nr:serine/threonine protein kinase [Planctomycetaceae bacterium]
MPPGPPVQKLSWQRSLRLGKLIRYSGGASSERKRGDREEIVTTNTSVPGDTEFPLPERVGPYQIESVLGAGGMGTVYLGRHVESDLQAAVKVLPASMAREPGFVARFNREIEAMRQISNANENIVELYDSGEDQGTYYYAMEYVPGETLTSRLVREKRIQWREVIEIGVQICRALKAAHNAGIIHRDLKPSNLMLRDDGIIKLTDFGVAQVFASGKLTLTGGILGTAEYMSPEQAQGKRATRHSDIYSLGAVLYVMLTGRPPFTGKTTLEIAQKHKFGQFDSPRRIVPEVPHWLDEVVCQCLAKKPEDRYPDAYVLGLRLQEIPKKVDMAQSGGTFAYGDADSSRETEAAHGAADPAVLGGTFMRDVMRAELEQQAQPGFLHRWFDNVWVLMGIFAVVVIASGWMIFNSRPSPQSLFSRGEALMQRPAGPAWDAAEREYFLPLLEQDAANWESRVRPFLDQIARYRLERELLGASGTDARQVEDPPSTILRRAHLWMQLGRDDQARADLTALITLIDEDEQYADQLRLARQLLEELAPGEASPEFTLLEQALTRAEKLAAAGEVDKARQIRLAIIHLYAEQTDATQYVERAQAALTE